MRPLSRFALILLAGILHAHAEQSYTASKIVFNHPGPYTQAQLETAVQIHPGTTFTATDLGTAAQRLLDTGFFENVGATLAGKITGATVLFDTKPIERGEMLHVALENFVWMSHEEIAASLRAKAPLFAGYLPENSPMQNDFDAVLTQALAAKGITARVTHETVEPTMLHPERVLEYRIASPRIRVANVKLGNVDPKLTPLIQKSVNAAATFSYNEGLAGQSTADCILSPLLDEGYIQASLENVSVLPAMTSDGATVVVSATLTTGDVYRVSGISFAGTPMLSAAEFAAGEKLHRGDVASRELLLETLEPLDAAYRRQGYMDVVIKAEPAIEAATHQVAYTVSAVPGDPYRIHEVTTNNLDAAAKDEFDRNFKMKSGQLYNPDYVREFLKANTALRALEGYVAAFKAYADPSSHTVDLVLTFAKMGRS